MGLETEDGPLITGSQESLLRCGTSGGLRAGTECTREVCLGLLDLVGRDLLLAMALGCSTCALEADAVELHFPLVIIVEYDLISSKSTPQANELE